MAFVTVLVYDYVLTFGEEVGLASLVNSVWDLNYSFIGGIYMEAEYEHGMCHRF